jgi:3',5'-cyclic AMP phosphodiesterase CpdA
LLIAQVTDPHVSTAGAALYGGYVPDRAFARALERLAGLEPRPDFVWLTGDLVDHGTADEYARFRELIAGFELPTAAIPGNHDRRDTFAAGLAGTGVAIGTEPFLHLVVEDHPIRMIGLDTVGPGDAGELCPARLAWLAARLAEAPDRPTLIFMHHPPFLTGIRAMDALRCMDGDGLAAIVAPHGQVLGVSAGHVHRSVQTGFAGTAGNVCPSVAWAVPLDLASDDPTRLVPQEPGFQLHLWRPGIGLVTHTEFLPGPA